jgi:HAE1 family hydrophobic/amphiphilic exporter-1
VSDLPNVDFPMANSVATPLERRFTSIAGLDSMVSVNRMGSSSITLQFALDRDIDGTEVDVETATRVALSRARKRPQSPTRARSFGRRCGTWVERYGVPTFTETLSVSHPPPQWSDR